MPLALAATGAFLALCAIALLIRVMMTARRVRRGEAGDDVAPVLKRMVIENGIALALAFLGLGLIIVSGVI
ncbi:MAG: hypothetical protein AAFT19_09790 [Pseudomonadota bacterium]